MATTSLNERLSLFANLGVVIGLAILILEVSQANKLSETQAYVTQLDKMQLALLAFADSEFLPELDVKARNEGVQSLSEVERLRLKQWYQSQVHRMEIHYYLYERGYLDEEQAKLVIGSAVATLEMWIALDVYFLDGRFERIVKEAAAARSSPTQ